jgi:D-alanyl-D-alanine carboxypeptidase/D-alanyl-D-alanine-endopeptidase (penicillin-binding protein 4)
VLARYGTGGRFSTSIYGNGSLVAGTLTGDLYIRGGGDPLFGNASYVTTNFGSGATIEKLAQGLEDAGVKKVTGQIFGDESVFDSRRGTAYSGFSRNGDIGGQLGGLMVNKGWVSGRWQANPPVYAAQRLRSAVRAVGITVGSKTGAAPTPVGAKRLSFVRSLPMSALVRQMDKPSNNYLAEMLAKSLAMPVSAADDDSDGGLVPLGNTSATTASGNSVSRRHAATFGSRVKLADGSGLSRSDNAAPREVVDLLRGVQKTVAFTDFKAALPIAGVDGTLASRMRGSAAARRCSAKTGTLSNVSSLSGYCTTVGGDLVAFSILQNRVSPAAAHGQQDRVAALIAALN